jgi:DNA-binding response OmpR family regulator
MKARVLIVDDEPRMAASLRTALERSGYECECAGNGAEALRALEARRADVVVSDRRMPEMDGLELLREVKARYGELPFVMMTAYADVPSAVEAMRAGAFDYVAKPFDFDYLDRAVAAGLARVTDKDGAVSPDGDPWKRLTLTVFRVGRAMEPKARTSTGERLETAALGAAREAASGRGTGAEEHLAEVSMLADLAAQFGDLPAADRALVESAVDAARRSLPSRR